MTPTDQEFLRGNPEGIAGDCVRACIATLLDLPREQVPHFVQLHGFDWAFHALEWCNANGHYSEWLRSRNWQDFNTNGLGMLTGLSPREGRHACVYEAGKLVHDPHPSRAGLNLTAQPGAYFDFWTFKRAG